MSTSNFEVWLEGYAATGEYDRASYLGRFYGPTFEEACARAVKVKGWDRSYYDEERNTYWGCAFYDNEQDARKSFG